MNAHHYGKAHIVKNLFAQLPVRMEERVLAGINADVHLGGLEIIVRLILVAQLVQMEVHAQDPTTAVVFQEHVDLTAKHDYWFS